ncbi:MAG: amidinotransferase [Clostridium sp.]|nr:amidinotransferase [Clostridium sp.]
MNTQKTWNLKKILLVILAFAVLLAVFLNIRVRTQPSMQTTDTVLMVSPAAFGFNEQTAGNNAFQKNGEGGNVSEQGRKESDDYIALLRENGIHVIAVEDTPEPHTPDSVFPNNWFTTHDDGTLVLYPMYAENRRLERKDAVLAAIRQNFTVRRIVDLTHYENQGLFLEGTGSMVLDRVNKIAYACRTPRTDETVLDDFCRQLGYSPVLFDAVDESGTQIYHTNVMMSVGSEVAVVCLEAIADPDQREAVRKSLEDTGKTILEITYDQMNHFAGNMLEVRNQEKEPCLIMSQAAYNSLTDEQLEFLESRVNLVTPALDCIEENGGGSARCMIAEIFSGK